jgi:hypothetical protein
MKHEVTKDTAFGNNQGKTMSADRLSNQYLSGENDSLHAVLGVLDRLFGADI